MTMASSEQHRFFTAIFRLAMAVLTGMCMLTAVGLQPAPAQTYTVIHNFTGGADGAGPGGLIIDAGGNLYGAASGGGLSSQNCDGTCGVVFKLKSSGQGWVLTPLYQFQGGSDGTHPGSVVFGPDGTLYGTTVSGGVSCPSDTQYGCGTVFNLRPQPSACKSALCPWTESVLYRFAGGSNDGAIPLGQPAFDKAGNFYGATYEGGVYTINCGFGRNWCGTVFELSPSNGGWTESLPYMFTGGNDGANPEAGLTLDAAGNLYGTAVSNGAGEDGTVFALTRSGSDWTENTLFSFTGSNGGAYPAAGLIFDPAGNLYGTTEFGGNGHGTVFELSPSGSGWTFNQVYAFAGGFGLDGPLAPVLRDSAGNLYGTTFEVGGGANVGEVFELSPSNGGWTYTVLHYFTDDHGDGGLPSGALALDAHGNLYGTTSTGGTYQLGTVWEITP